MEETGFNISPMEPSSSFTVVNLGILASVKENITVTLKFSGRHIDITVYDTFVNRSTAPCKMNRHTSTYVATVAIVL
jgi:hypothetical protein